MEITNTPFSLIGKAILVTGASSGIGRATAIMCSRMGAKVVLMGRDYDRLEQTHSLLSGSDHIVSSVDLLDYQGVETELRSVLDGKIKLNGVVNCAGISTTLPFSSIKPDRIELFLKTNVIGAMNLTRLSIKKEHFSEQGGSIIFISSIMGIVGEKGKSLYSMTKGALDAGVRSLSVELATRNIRVNSISPGVVKTPMSKSAIYSQTEESQNKISDLHPLGLGSPEDVANACVYLLSDASRWITGINLVVDGGYTAR